VTQSANKHKQSQKMDHLQLQEDHLKQAKICELGQYCELFILT